MGKACGDSGRRAARRCAQPATGRYDGCTTCLACIEACPTGALRVGAGPARPKEQS
ncbi:MAG: 4Fe-4S binding protein [Vicinamibacteraceae bacterium]|nr:4Fe-4S binding protein [Vicinamibacteraceae bacterium]